MPEVVEEKFWIYRSGGEEVLSLREGRLVAAPSAAKEVSPRMGIWVRSIFGWSLRVEVKEGKKIVLASYGMGGNVPELFKNVFVIDTRLGRVKALSSPGQEELPLLELTDDEPVFIPVLGRKGREGGVLVTSARALRISQNKGRIEGFLKA